MMAAGASEIVLDFSNVTMIDSAGIGLVVAAHNTLGRAGGKLAIVHAAPDVFELLAAMRIPQHMEVSGN